MKLAASDESRSSAGVGSDLSLIPADRFISQCRPVFQAATAMPSFLASIKSALGLNPPPTEWSVSIEETARSGSVTYREAAGRLLFYWEFGGGDTLAMIGIGTVTEWQRRHPWAAPRRAEILERVATEVIRQKAPRSRAEIDDQAGYMILR